MEENRAEDKGTPKQGRKKKRKSKKRLIIPIYILIVFLLIFIVYVYPSITGAMKQTMVAEYGNLRISDTVTCYIVKNETVYYSNGEGDINYAFDEGVMTRSGAEILTILPATIGADMELGTFGKRAAGFLSGDTLLMTDKKAVSSLKQKLVQQMQETNDEVEQQELGQQIEKLESVGKKLSSDQSELSRLGVIPESYVMQKPGIISYMLDGYESEINPYTMTLLDKSKMDKVENGFTDISRQVTRYGEPLFKVIDSDAWYAVTWISEDDLGKYSEGSKVSLSLPDGTANGVIDRVSETNDQIMVIMKFNTYYDSIATLRKVSAEIVTSDSNGLMIENSYLMDKNGQTGVLVLGITGKENFVPVKVKATNGEYAIVESGVYYEYNEETGESVEFDTIEVYDEIVKPD